MRIAVIGAGLSGLSFAHHLWSDVDTVDIYDRVSGPDSRTRPVQLQGIMRFVNSGKLPLVKEHSILKELVFSMNWKDPAKDGIRISPRFSCVGWSYLRGSGEKSVDNQLYELVKGKENVVFHWGERIGKGDLEELKGEYDYVIIATGQWRNLIEGEEVRGAGYGFSVEKKGYFDPKRISTALNNEIAPHGYYYILPYDRDTAECVTCFLFRDGINGVEYRNRLRDFLEEDGFTIHDSWVDMGSWDANWVKNAQFPECIDENVIKIGDAANLIEIAFGFGMSNAIESGKVAATAINNNDMAIYSGYLGRKEKEMRWFLRARNTYNRLDGTGYKKFMDIINTPQLRFVIGYGNHTLFKVMLRSSDIWLKDSKDSTKQ